MSRETLIAWGVQMLGERLKQAVAALALRPLPDNGIDRGAYRAVLTGGEAKTRPSRLLSWLSLVYPKEEKNADCEERPSGKEVSPPPYARWQNFAADFGRLPEGEHRFEAFAHLLRRYGDGLPGTFDERISLYGEWQVLAALLFASGGAAQPAEKFWLIGGDTSGIQDFLYNVSYQGAAKGLRGRSFFLQLLSDAVVRGLLQELGLTWVNVVYAAGGNFLLLSPFGGETEDVLKAYRQRVNDALFAAAQGRLRLVLGWAELAQTAAANPAAWLEGVRAVKEKQGAAKARPFAEQSWETVFAPFDEGGDDYCAVCHRGPEENENVEAEWRREEETWVCPLCDSFGKLANDIRYEDLWMGVTREENPGNGRAWDDVLAQLSGFRYRFYHDEGAEKPGFVYAINQPDFLAAGAHGCHTLANVTPLVTQGDLDWWHAQPEGRRPEYEGGSPRKDAIRDFDLMARDAAGVKWLGVLRMDVDNLGAVFTQWLPERALPGAAAMSREMETFFSERLNGIVKENATIKDKSGEERLAAYIIYAGGDDLFSVGAWHFLPRLAEAIHQEFQTYTGNDCLTISAGISLMPRTKTPLYLAAQQAAVALDDKAKGKRMVLYFSDKARQVKWKWREKNAVCFLNTAVGWQEWAQARELADLLVSLQQAGAPRALIQTVRQIHALFEKGREKYEEEHPGRKEGVVDVYPAYYGRWHWMAQYQFGRMIGQAKRQKNEALAAGLESVRQTVGRAEVTSYTGLASRWAEFRTRKRENDGGKTV